MTRVEAFDFLNNMDCTMDDHVAPYLGHEAEWEEYKDKVAKAVSLLVKYPTVLAKAGETA